MHTLTAAFSAGPLFLRLSLAATFREGRRGRGLCNEGRHRSSWANSRKDPRAQLAVMCCGGVWGVRLKERVRQRRSQGARERERDSQAHLCLNLTAHHPVTHKITRPQRSFGGLLPLWRPPPPPPPTHTRSHRVSDLEGSDDDDVPLKRREREGDAGTRSPEKGTDCRLRMQVYTRVSRQQTFFHRPPDVCCIRPISPQANPP
jgi:hypothetical protein